ncbi:MAG: ABC transporter ATP-binding protein [Actinomycetota bacterium]
MTLEVGSLSRSFGDPPVPALSEVTFTAEKGSFTAVVGASGSGKSTLLRLLGGLLEPTSGSVSMGGRRAEELRADKAVGWMAQQPALLPWRKVVDNIALAQKINPRPDRSGTAEPRALLDMVGLSHAAELYPGQLSGGMQQRVALARTLAIGAPLWLMDEPFSSLDELTREALAADLLAVWQEVRPTVVWVTHHIPEAVALADRVVVLTPSPGRVAGIVGVDLSRPREPTSGSFQDVVRRVRTLLRGVHPAEVVA